MKVPEWSRSAKQSAERIDDGIGEAGDDRCLVLRAGLRAQRFKRGVVAETDRDCLLIRARYGARAILRLESYISSKGRAPESKSDAVIRTGTDEDCSWHTISRFAVVARVGPPHRVEFVSRCSARRSHRPRYRITRGTKRLARQQLLQARPIGSRRATVILRRVERAKLLLQGGDLPLAEVAAHVGFSDQSQSSHHFKRLIGVTPGQFRTPARIA
jgi:AraC-like DNA-binding protein